jgi:arylsulfatase A-like enzyme
MTTQFFMVLGALAPLVSPLGALPGSDQPVARNVLVVIADDLGVDKVGAYGYRTPTGSPTAGKTRTLDLLAENGILFRNAWSNPTCSPTRATCMTGQYSFRTGIGHWIKPMDFGLATRFDALPEILPDQYRTAAVGKWHLGGASGCSPLICTGGQSHGHHTGFEFHEGSFYNLIEWGASGYNNWVKTRSDASGSSATPMTRYATTITVDDTLRTIEDFGDDPWFVWMAFNAPHSPWHEPPSHLYDGPPLGPNPTSNPLTAVKAMTEAMDKELGRLLATVDPEVLAQTTIVFFGDNGTKGSAMEAPFDPADGKGSLYNSGVQVPFIVCSPGIPPELRGSECDGLVNTTDVYATVAELTGGDSSAGIDSVSFLPYFTNPGLPSIREFLFAEKFPDNFVPPGIPEHQSVTLREARFKLIRKWNGHEQFYDLENDFHEEQNLMPSGSPSDLWPIPGASEAYIRLSRELERLCGC